MISILALDFMVRALLAGALTGVMAPAVGSYIVQRKLSLLGDGLGHVAIAGVGLAGELGAGITLVSEVLHKSIRGYGTMIVASVGVSGAILANFVAKGFDWRTAFYVAGLPGVVLAILVALTVRELPRGHAEGRSEPVAQVPLKEVVRFLLTRSASDNLMAEEVRLDDRQP